VRIIEYDSVRVLADTMIANFIEDGEIGAYVSEGSASAADIFFPDHCEVGDEPVLPVYVIEVPSTVYAMLGLDEIGVAVDVGEGMSRTRVKPMADASSYGKNRKVRKKESDVAFDSDRRYVPPYAREWKKLSYDKTDSAHITSLRPGKASNGSCSASSSIKREKGYAVILDHDGRYIPPHARDREEFSFNGVDNTHTTNLRPNINSIGGSMSLPVLKKCDSASISYRVINTSIDSADFGVVNHKS